MEDEEVALVSARGISFDVAENGQVSVNLTYFKLPKDAERIRLTLTMEAAQMEQFAQSLLTKAREVRAANVKH